MNLTTSLELPSSLSKSVTTLVSAAPTKRSKVVGLAELIFVENSIYFYITYKLKTVFFAMYFMNIESDNDFLIWFMV